MASRKRTNAAPAVTPEKEKEAPVTPVEETAESLTDAEVEVVTATIVEPLDEAEFALVVAEAETLNAPRYADITFGVPKKGKAWAAFGKGDDRIKTYVPEGYGVRTLSQLEEVVAEGLAKFIDAGNALLEIRMRKLWEGQGFSSFGTYAVARFNLSRSRLYQLIDIAQVSAILIGSGVEVPRLSNRNSDLAVLKDNPELLAEVTQTLNEASPTGDLSDLPRNEVRDAVAEAANEAGKNLVADRSIVPSDLPADDEDEDEDEEEEEDEEDEEDEEEEDEEAPAPEARSTPTVRRASPAPVRASDKVTPASLVTVMAAFETGAYIDQAGETRSAIQRIAAMCLSYMAGDFFGAPPKVSPTYTVSVTAAKEIVKSLKKASDKAKAKAALSGDQAAQVAKNEAAVAASAPAAPVVTPAESVAEMTLERAFTIRDARDDWKAAGGQGQSPYTATEYKRAVEFLDARTTDEGVGVTPETAEPVVEVVAEVAQEMTDDEVEALMADLDEDIATGATVNEAEEEETEEDEIDSALSSIA